MGTAASEPRCRCVYLHHGLDPLLGPTVWKDVATIRPLEAGSASCRVLFVVQVPQGPLPMAVVPRGKKGGL